MKSKVVVGDGKYTIVEDLQNGKIECLRHGETWTDLVGDGMVLSMFYRIQELEGGLVQIYESILNNYDDEDKVLKFINTLIK